MMGECHKASRLDAPRPDATNRTNQHYEISILQSLPCPLHLLLHPSKAVLLAHNHLASCIRPYRATLDQAESRRTMELSYEPYESSPALPHLPPQPSSSSLAPPRAESEHEEEEDEGEGEGEGEEVEEVEEVEDGESARLDSLF